MPFNLGEKVMSFVGKGRKEKNVEELPIDVFEFITGSGTKEDPYLIPVEMMVHIANQVGWRPKEKVKDKQSISPDTFALWLGEWIKEVVAQKIESTSWEKQYFSIREKFTLAQFNQEGIGVGLLDRQIHHELGLKQFSLPDNAELTIQTKGMLYPNKHNREWTEVKLESIAISAKTVGNPITLNSDQLEYWQEEANRLMRLLFHDAEIYVNKDRIPYAAELPNGHFRTPFHSDQLGIENGNLVINPNAQENTLQEWLAYVLEHGQEKSYLMLDIHEIKNQKKSGLFNRVKKIFSEESTPPENPFPDIPPKLHLLVEIRKVGEDKKKPVIRVAIFREFPSDSEPLLNDVALSKLEKTQRWQYIQYINKLKVYYSSEIKKQLHKLIQKNKKQFSSSLQIEELTFSSYEF